MQHGPACCLREESHESLLLVITTNMLTEISRGRKVPERFQNAFPPDQSLIKQVPAIVGRCARGCTVELYLDLRNAFFAEKRSAHVRNVWYSQADFILPVNCRATNFDSE